MLDVAKLGHLKDWHSYRYHIICSFCRFDIIFNSNEIQTPSSAVRGGGVRKAGPIMAVPKPINLPSRKAENNGFDPNLQLVPGGSWGSGGNARPATAQPTPGSAAGQPAPPKTDGGGESSPLALAPTRAPWSAAPAGASGGPSRGGTGQDFPRLGPPYQGPPPQGSFNRRNEMKRTRMG